jgi:hypothetical protein
LIPNHTQTGVSIVFGRRNPTRIAAEAVYRGEMVMRHERFALHGVTFAGLSMPTATMDCWQDNRGQAQWIARVLVASRCPIDAGEFCGQTADGRALSGHALVADQQVGPGGRRSTLVVLHGSGTLHGF